MASLSPLGRQLLEQTRSLLLALSQLERTDAQAAHLILSTVVAHVRSSNPLIATQTPSFEIPQGAVTAVTRIDELTHLRAIVESVTTATAEYWDSPPLGNRLDAAESALHVIAKAVAV